MNPTKPTPGSTWTNGSPSDTLVATGECSKCGDQIMGKRIKSRAAAIESMREMFADHVCDPDQAEAYDPDLYKGIPWAPRDD